MLLSGIEYKDFRGQILVESNKKLSEQKEYFKEDYVKMYGSFAV